MKKKPTLEEMQEIAEAIVQTPIEWDGDKGYFLCPMHMVHTSPTKDKHTVCYLDGGAPTFYCWHNSCREYMEEVTKELRHKLDFRTPEEKAEDKLKAATKRQLKCDARKVIVHCNAIFDKFYWDIFSSPYSASDSWGIFLSLWGPQDNIWVGDVWDTGEKGAQHFLAVEQWLDHTPNLYANRYTTTSSFKPGTVDRTNKQVLSTPYLVVEFDALDEEKEENKRKGAAFLNYLRQSFDLRMVVDSGNKSLHGWFLNNDKVTEEQRFMLRQLGADPNTMRPSQPVRVPGGRRDNGKVQSVLWIV